MRKADLRRLLSKGLSIRKTAVELGTSFTNVRYWIKKYKIQPRKRHGLKAHNDCLYCGEPINDLKKRNVYCSYTCHKTHQYKTYIERWLAGDESGNRGTQVSCYIRRYLHEQTHSRCSKCGWSEVNPKTGKIPLTVNHKDGDWGSSRPENIELLCPNCHSLTPNYGSLNKGNGRPTKGRR